jgi:hypothetical protein
MNIPLMVKTSTDKSLQFQCTNSILQKEVSNSGLQNNFLIHDSSSSSIVSTLSKHHHYKHLQNIETFLGYLAMVSRNFINALRISITIS